MTDPKTPPHGPPRSTKGETEIIPVGVVEEAADVALELGVDDVLVRLAPVARRAWTTAVKPFCTVILCPCRGSLDISTRMESETMMAWPPSRRAVVVFELQLEVVRGIAAASACVSPAG